MLKRVSCLAFLSLVVFNTPVLADGEYLPALKARLQSVTPALMKERNLPFATGVLVLSTDQSEVNLQKNDIIFAVDDTPVADVNALKTIVAELPVGTDTELHIVRDKEEDTSRFTVAITNGHRELRSPEAHGTHWRHRYWRRHYYSNRKAQPYSNRQTQPAGTAFSVVHTYYGTDRTVDGSSDDNATYGSDRGTLVYGRADVTIPVTHKPGHIDTAWIKNDPDSAMTVQSATPLERSAFYADITKNPSKTALIFVHGYYNSFEDAALRTAQLAYDMRFPGIPAFFSWPSQGALFGYVTDEGNVSWALADFKTFLTDYVANSKAEKFYLVCHSMGCRLLTQALKELYAQDPKLRGKIVEVFLAAPDIDAGDFKTNTVQSLIGNVNSITIYQSSKDWALKASLTWHSFQRLGDCAGGVTILSGMNTIDATKVDTSLIGHSYFGDSTSVIADMVDVVGGHLDPAERQHLKRKAIAAGNYWLFEN